MTRPPAGDIERRRCSILVHERAVARTIAAEVVEKPTLSVWMLLIPLLFVHYMQRQQVFRRAVVQVSEALVRSRCQALDLACGELGLEAVPHDELCANDEDGRIRTLRNVQNAEVDLLTRHYLKLLTAGASDYRELVRRAYGDRDAYREMLAQLQAMERRVGAAAAEARPDPNAAEFLQRLDRARFHAHARDLELAFG